MASIFKRSKRKKNAAYWIQYTDHDGKRRTTKGFTDRSLTEQLAAKLENEAMLRRRGIIDPEEEKFSTQKLAPIDIHLSAFESSIEDNSPKYVRLTMTRIRRTVEGCEFSRLADINKETLQNFLRDLCAAEDLGRRTYNHYIQALDCFCNWCVATERLLRNPLIGLERLNAEVDVRHPRRALAPEEFDQLLDSARTSGVQIQRYSGEMRARLYTLSYMTGLRKGELASLTVSSFDLDATLPTVTIQAGASKHRRKDVLPLHPELVALLRDWLKGMKKSQHPFPGLAGKKTWEMVKKDLERVGIAYRTEEGIADFHAAGRHTHITGLLRNGASLPEARKLARHSDIKMTMRYTHIGIDDQAKALAMLPAPKPQPAKDDGNGDALQMRCNPADINGHSSSSADIDKEGQKRQNPRRSKGFDTSRRRLSPDDTMEAAGIESATDQ